MTRKKTVALAVVAVAVGVIGTVVRAAPERPSLAGRWALNRELSQFPGDVGFGMDLVSGADTGGERGGGGGLSAAALLSGRVSEDDAKRKKLLVDAVRNPSSRLTIAQTDAALTIVDDRGRSLTFHPDGREETQLLDEVPVTTTTRWEGERLVIRYKVEQNRELRYAFSRSADPPRLVVEVQFIERGGRDTVTRVYEPARADEPAKAVEPAKANAAAAPDRAVPPEAPRTGAGTPPGAARASDLARPAAPEPQDRVAAPVVAGGPDAELRGLADLGIVVEAMSAQAAACGLREAPIEAAVSKSFADAGFKVRRNSDEDTYIYVHVMAASASSGMCVSGYDVYLYSHTTGTLAYQTAPVLVQVLLLHRGGIAGGPPAALGDAVVRGVKQYADEFASRIRAANQPRR